MTELSHSLEEERRIINAATEWWTATHYTGPVDDSEVSYFWEGTEFSLAHCPDCGITANFSSGDATFIAHARTALPLRNAQVQATHDTLSTMEGVTKAGRSEYTDGMEAVIKYIRRAIEEAGA